MALDSAVGLIYTLSAKSDDAEVKKFSKSVEDETKNIEERGKNAFNSLAQSIGLSAEQTAQLSAALPIAGAAIAGIAAAAVGVAASLFAVANQASEFGSAIKDASDKTGLGAETISTLKFAADQAGSGLEGVSGSVTKFSKLIGSAAEGSKEAKESLTRLGLDPKAAINDLDGSLEKVFKTIYDAQNPIVATKLATEAFGKSGADLIPVIKQMNGDFGAFKTEATRLGVVLTDSDASAADDFGDSLAQLKAQAQGVAFQFAKEFMPSITGAMQEVGEWIAKNRSAITWWGQEVKSEFLTAIDLAEKLAKLWKILVAPDWESIKSAYNEKTSAQLRADERETYKNVAGYDSEAGDYQPFRSKKSDTDSSALKDFTKEKTPKVKKEKFELSADGKALVEAANRLGISPTDLASIISYETSGTFSSKIKGGKGGNYTGLIQFGKEEYQKYNVGKNQDFKSQLLNSVVPYFRDRFASVGRNTTGANLLDLYKTVNGGNPNVSSNASDGNGTIAEHVRRISEQHRPKVIKKFFGGQSSNAPKDEISADLEKESARERKVIDQITKDREEADKRVLLSTRQTADENLSINKDLLAKKQISQDEFDDRGDKADIEGLNKEKNILEERLAFYKQSSADALANEKLSTEDRLALTTQFGEESIKTEEEIAAKVSEIKIKQTEAETAAYLKSKKYQEDLKSLRLETLQTERELIDFRKEQERKILSNDAEFSRGQARLDALVVLREFDIEENNRRAERQREDATRAHDTALEAIADKTAEKEKVDELNAAYKNQIDLINGIRDANNQDITVEFNRSRQGTGSSVFDSIKQGIFGEDSEGNLTRIKGQAEVLGGVYDNLSKSIKNSVDGMTGALGSAIEGYLLYGDSIGKALRKAAAAELAHIASVSAIKAIYELAEGFALLFINPAASAAHFQAAAIYGVVAIGAGIGAKALAGSKAIQQQTATGANNPATGGNSQNGGGRSSTQGAFSSAGDNVTTFESGINAPQVVRHEIDLTDRDGRKEAFVLNVLHESGNNNGKFRDFMRTIVEGL